MLRVALRTSAMKKRVFSAKFTLSPFTSHRARTSLLYLYQASTVGISSPLSKSPRASSAHSSFLKVCPLPNETRAYMCTYVSSRFYDSRMGVPGAFNFHDTHARAHPRVSSPRIYRGRFKKRSLLPPVNF